MIHRQRADFELVDTSVLPSLRVSSGIRIQRWWLLDVCRIERNHGGADERHGWYHWPDNYLLSAHQ